MEIRIKGMDIWGIKSEFIEATGLCSYSKKNEEFCFTTGVNFLIGSYHEYNWTIPYVLSHKSDTFFYYNNTMHKRINLKSVTEYKKIYTLKNKMKYTFDYMIYDQNNVDIESVLNISSYIGEKKYRLEKELTYYIRKGCKKSKIDFNEFINISGELKTYFSNNLKNLYYQRLYYHSLIAISEGKKILCYPWIQSLKFLNMEEKISNLNRIAQYYDCILLIPVLNEECL